METDQRQVEQQESMTVTPMTSSIVYDDDEPVTSPPDTNAAGNGVLELSTHCEYPALPLDVARRGFAVMVHVRAPALSPAEARRAPLDLVAVLDVSDGETMSAAKRAVAFVADRILGPRDRLGVVAVSSGGDARRVTPLTRMTEDGKAAAKHAVEEALVAAAADAGRSSPANVQAGLDEAAKVLQGRRHRRNNAGVVFLSDGSVGGDSTTTATATDSCVSLSLPEFFRDDGDWWRAPVHTFGLGAGVDAAALHRAAELTGGTFSFVEDVAAAQDAVAQCVAGLRSVTALGVWVEVKPWFERARVTAVKPGGRYNYNYKSSVREDEHTVFFDELYADEERRFLVFLDIPPPGLYDDDDDGDDGNGYGTITVIKTRGGYMDVATGHCVELEFEDTDAEVLGRRDEAAAAAAAAATRCVEVERELLRVAAAEDMALALDAAERGDYGEAARILDARRESLGRASPAMSGDATCAAVAAELRELSRRVSDEREYGRTGRACLLAGVSSHAAQRGCSVRLSAVAGTTPFGCVGSSVFATPAMRKMEKLSEMLRRKQEAAAAAAAPLPENAGSKSVRPRSRLEARLASAVPRLSMFNRYRRLLVKR